MSIGNLEAIGYWIKGRQYCKSDIDKFFLDSAAGYIAYQLTFVGDLNSEVNVSGGTSLKEYSFKLDSSGKATKLLFFSSGETITVTDGTYTVTKTLSDRVDSIRITPVKYKFIKDWYANNDSHIPDATADIATFVEDFIKAYYNAYYSYSSYASWQAEMNYLKDHIPEIIQYINTRNTSNAKGIGITTNRHNGNPEIRFSFIGPSSTGVNRVNQKLTARNYEYYQLVSGTISGVVCSVFDTISAGGTIQTNYVTSGAYLTYIDGTDYGNKNEIGIDLASNSTQASGTNMGIYY